MHSHQHHVHICAQRAYLSDGHTRERIARGILQGHRVGIGAFHRGELDQHKILLILTIRLVDSSIHP